MQFMLLNKFKEQQTTQSVDAVSKIPGHDLSDTSGRMSWIQFMRTPFLRSMTCTWKLDPAFSWFFGDVSSLKRLFLKINETVVHRNWM